MGWGLEAANGACGPGGSPGPGGGGGEGGAAGLAEASPSRDGDTAAIEGGEVAGISGERGSFNRSRCTSITSRCSPSSSQVIVYVGRLQPNGAPFRHGAVRDLLKAPLVVTSRWVRK